jgi:hypothetical protein
MSPEACEVLMGQIAPRLRAAIPRSVHTVGAEDHEELIQDGMAMAARMLHNSEAAGKLAPAASVAYYTIQHLRSGRRSTGSSCADVMGVGTQFAHKSSVLSMEDEVGWDPELDEPIALGELLASRVDDPAMAATRNIDWEEFLSTHDYRYGVIVKGIAEGQKPGETARANGMTTAQLKWLVLEMAADVLEHMGEDILQDAMQIPSWRGDLRVKSERVACMADRRRG